MSSFTKKSMDPLKIVIVGPPGSGKEVQGKELAKKYELQYTGYRQCLVHHLTKKTELGEQFRPFYTKKKALPGELMNQMLHKVIDSNKGFVIKGYPITEAQADSFIEEFSPDLCIFIRVPQEVSRERLNYRRIDPETREVYNIKSDPPPDKVSPRVRRMKSDSPLNINKRLSTYYESSNFYNSVVKKFSYFVEVDGKQSKEEVKDQIINQIERYLEIMYSHDNNKDFDEEERVKYLIQQDLLLCLSIIRVENDCCEQRNNKVLKIRIDDFCDLHCYKFLFV